MFYSEYQGKYLIHMIIILKKTKFKKRKLIKIYSSIKIIKLSLDNSNFKGAKN